MAKEKRIYKNKYAYELCFLKKLLQKEKSNFLLFFNRLFEDYLEIRSIFAIKEPLENYLEIYQIATVLVAF